MYGSTSSAAAASLTTNTTSTNSNMFYHHTSGSAAADLALNLGHQSAAAMRTSTLNVPVSMLPPLSPLSLPALPLDALNAVGK